MRLFVAVNFPARLRQRIARLAGPLDKAGIPCRWVAPEQVHLTLKFIGDVPSARVDELGHALTSVATAFRPFTLRFGRIGAFPSPRLPRVIWLAVELTPELRFLKDDLERALLERGVEREQRPFQPHITLGRTARDAEAGEFRSLEDAARNLGISAEYRVTHLDLMRSRLDPGGAVHTRVVTAWLGRDESRGSGGRGR